MPPTLAPEISSQAIIVMTHLPNLTEAENLVSYLLENHLAACVNIMAPCTSVYRWQGNIERSIEIAVMIKSTSARYSELEAAILSLHPYELPEIIHVTINGGLEAYLGWINCNTQTNT
jgi:periplasmic divalent cation tolerance protein